jgi:hypothetical protein
MSTNKERELNELFSLIGAKGYAAGVAYAFTVFRQTFIDAATKTETTQFTLDDVIAIMNVVERVCLKETEPAQHAKEMMAAYDFMALSDDGATQKQ